MAKEESFGVIPLKIDGGQWKVFLIQHAAGHWGFPKGKAEEGESVRSCGARELREETGLEIHEWLLVRPYLQDYSFQRDGEFVKKSVTYCLAIVKGNPELDQNEVIAGKWVTIEEAPKQLTYDACRKLALDIPGTLEYLQSTGWVPR